MYFISFNLDESFYTLMKFTTIDKGIIDLDSNPFAHESWINQGFGFTPKRQNQIKNLFGQSAENILISEHKSEIKATMAFTQSLQASVRRQCNLDNSD